MRTRLDDLLFQLLDETPNWSDVVSADQVPLAQRRREGASLNQIAREFGLTKAGVRLRLYGTGVGMRRGGGLLGQLRILARRHVK